MDAESGTREQCKVAKSLFIEFNDELAPKATIFFIYPLLCDPSQYPLGFDVFPHPHIGLSILFIIILLMLLLILYHLELTCLQGFERVPDLNLTLYLDLSKVKFDV